MASTFPQRAGGRRRQRSVRVTVATSLVSLATLVVVLALPTQSPLWLSLSSVFALVAGGAASRIVYAELLQSRRDAARDRATQASAYRAMFSERAGEHAEFTTVMTDRLVARDREIRELEATVRLGEKRALEAESRVRRESRRANDAVARVAELQEALEIRRAEEADELASWDPESDIGGMLGADLPTVVDLLAWEDKVTAGTRGDTATRKQA